MQAGGPTEIISYFLGYLHIALDPERFRDAYEDPARSKSAEDWTLESAADGLRPAQDEELGSAPTAPVAISSIGVVGPHLTHTGMETLSRAEGPPLARFTLPSPPPAPRPVDSVTIYGPGGTPVDEDPTPVQKLAEIDQVNKLVDDDHYNTDLTVEHFIGVDPLAETAALHAMAVDAIPADVTPAVMSNDGALQWVLQRAEAGGQGGAGEQADAAGPAHAMAPGVYVDGVLVSEAPDATAPELVVPEHQNGGADGGEHQVAQLGGNVSENAAVVVDFSAASGSMIVMGDLIKVNQIVQVNAFEQADSVSGGETSSVIDPAAGSAETLARNIAQYIQETPEVTLMKGDASTEWRIDVVEGDFIHLTTLEQTNVVVDGDVVAIGPSHASTRIIAGGNEQANVGELLERLSAYDLIVVEGDMVSANLIYQMNVVYDTDFVVVSGGDGTGPLVIANGNNWLQNNGTIHTIGAAGSTALSGDLEQFARGLADGEAGDTSVFWEYSGAASATMDVLYITGDFYTINVVAQTNIVTDADAAVLVASELGPGTQWVNTGANVASNAATIVAVGSLTDPYVGGEVYEEATLVQIDVVSDEPETAATHQVDQLANELVAFLTDSDTTQAEAPAHQAVSTSHDNLLGGVMA